MSTADPPRPAPDGSVAPPQFTAVRRVRSFDDIVEQIREAIVAGQIRSGERLPNERDLARQFGVSRSTLREALRALEALDVIEIRPGAAGGIFAREPGADHVGAALEAVLRFERATALDLAEFRTSFEGENAYWASKRADESDLARLADVLDRFRSAARVDDVPWAYFVDADIEFHEAVARASKNQVRVAIMRGINSAMHRVAETLEPMASLEVREEIADELEAIAAAIAERDAEDAKQLMRRHVARYSRLPLAFTTETQEE